MPRSLRDEGLLVLEGGGAILRVARGVTRVGRAAGLEAPIIGGVAVVLHGYTRTTIDVDVFVGDALQPMAEALTRAGYVFDRRRREFRRGTVPVHLVTAAETQVGPVAPLLEIEGVRTVGLPDLVSMKLASGLSSPLRAIDLADVIGLIRVHRLGATFAGKLAKSVRVEFRKLARAVAAEE